MNHNSGVTFHPTCLAKSLRLLKEHTLLPDQRLLSWRLLQSLCLVFYDSIRANVDELDEQVWNMQLWNVLSIIQDAALRQKSGCIVMSQHANQRCMCRQATMLGIKNLGIKNCVCIWKSKAHNERLSESLQYSAVGKTNLIFYTHIYTHIVNRL